MKNALEAFLVLSLSVAATVAVLACALPAHPFWSDAGRSAPVEIQPAVYVTGMDSRNVLVGISAECPFGNIRSEALCPGLARLDGLSLCPYFAADSVFNERLETGTTGSRGGCPFLNDGAGAEPGASGECPRSQVDESSPPGTASGDVGFPLLARLGLGPADADERG
jgi:hypothetical protein